MSVTTVLINGQQYYAVCTGGMTDPEWGNRKVRKIKMGETYKTMQQLFPAGGTVSWATVSENGDAVSMDEWPLCGPITDNRDGTYTVKVGARLERETRAELDAATEALRIIMEGE